MADEKYIIPENPAYQAEDIRKLQDNDPASATNTFNPLVQKILESIAHNKKHKAELDATGKVLKEQLPEMNFADLNDKGMPGGFASLDDTGKVRLLSTGERELTLSLAKPLPPLVSAEEKPGI